MRRLALIDLHAFRHFLQTELSKPVPKHISEVVAEFSRGVTFSKIFDLDHLTDDLASQIPGLSDARMAELALDASDSTNGRERLARYLKAQPYCPFSVKTRLEPQFELFDRPRWRTARQLQLKLQPGFQPGRFTIQNSDRDRMIQIQDTRLLLNWRKRLSGEKVKYPSYKVLIADFEVHYALLEQFVAEHARSWS